MELTQDELKTLKLFSYMCKSHGVDEGIVEVHTYDGGYDITRYAYEDDGPSKVELYDKIYNLIQKIIDENNLTDYSYDDSSGNGRLDFIFDCDDRNLEVIGYSQVMSSRAAGDKIEFEDVRAGHPEVVEYLNKLRDNGLDTKEIYFNGGGDSGEIETPYGTTKELETFLYRWLANFYGGWEIDEGSYGSFIFDSKEMSVTLDFNENYYSMESNGRAFYVEF